MVADRRRDEVRKRLDLIDRTPPKFRQRVVRSPPPATPPVGGRGARSGAWGYIRCHRIPGYDVVSDAVVAGFDELLSLARQFEIREFRHRPGVTREPLVSSRSRNGHRRISIAGAVWQNAVDRQIIGRGRLFQDCGRDDA
jgi:hypothetical protein